LFRLNQKMPRTIDRIEVVYDAARDERRAIVTCKNGHKIERPEKDLFTEDFLATLSLVYDLPSR
jgi:hypothetical protein